METITESKTKPLIAEEVDSHYVERTQAEGEVQIEDTLIDMLQFGQKISSNGVKTASTRFPESMMIKLFSRGAADDAMLEYFDGRSQSDTFINDVVKRIVSIPLFILPVAGIIKQHVILTIDECRLAQLHADL